MAEGQGSVFPEFLERDDLEVGKWDVHQSSVPETDLEKRVMHVPLSNDEHSRSVRSREMMRAKVSPSKLVITDEYADNGVSSLRLVAACEDYRIDSLLKSVGVSTDGIDNRTLSFEVDRAIASNDANALVEITVRNSGNKSKNAVARAVRVSAKKHNKPGAVAFAKELRKAIKYESGWWGENDYKWYKTRLADTTPTVREIRGENITLPNGYNHSQSLALSLTRFMQRNGGGWGPPGRNDEADIPDIGSRPEASDMPSSFAPLKLDKLRLTERVAGRMGRKRSATNMGVNPRRIHRYLVDPEKRIFDKRIKGIGGVVLIDQSGSMNLSTDDVWDIIKASPGATIIGYSHGGSEIPNCWVLAENGKVVAEARDGNGGNGVDGPALLFALTKRKKNEPLIWVCDGHVTGDGDGHTYALAEWCARVVVANKVYMAEDVPEAVEALKQVRDGRTLPTRSVGPIYNAIERLQRRAARAS